MVTDDYRGYQKGVYVRLRKTTAPHFQIPQAHRPALQNAVACCILLFQHLVALVRKNMASPKKTGLSATQVDLYDKLIATHPEIERRGAANPYTSLNGNMFTLLHDSRRLAIRLPQDQREEFLKKHQTTLFEAYGAVMKEYVAVPDALLKNTKELQKYLELSYQYVRTLKPKPTRKKS